MIHHAMSRFAKHLGTEYWDCEVCGHTVAIHANRPTQVILVCGDPTATHGMAFVPRDGRMQPASAVIEVPELANEFYNACRLPTNID